MTLTALDYLIIAAYVLATLAIGIGFSRRAGKSLNEFFISGRSLPWWIAGTSMVATTFAADTPLAVTGLVIKDGFAGNWIWRALPAAGIVTAFGHNERSRRSEVVTEVEVVGLRVRKSIEK
ncbi:MAG: sodium:proline symporter, partial [Planctomycetaceae bacterium]|nr:sodium:proline symporter [Planctomycetaceae bacterium]